MVPKNKSMCAVVGVQILDHVWAQTWLQQMQWMRHMFWCNKCNKSCKTCGLASGTNTMYSQSRY